MTASYYYIFRSEYNVQFKCHNHILERDWKWKCYDRMWRNCDKWLLSGMVERVLNSIVQYRNEICLKFDNKKIKLITKKLEMACAFIITKK